MLLLFRCTLVILHILRMRRNVNRNVFNDLKNVSATSLHGPIQFAASESALHTATASAHMESLICVPTLAICYRISHAASVHIKSQLYCRLHTQVSMHAHRSRCANWVTLSATRFFSLRPMLRIQQCNIYVGDTL